MFLDLITYFLGFTAIIGLGYIVYQVLEFTGLSKYLVKLGEKIL